jgi:hypothetical protein
MLSPVPPSSIASSKTITEHPRCRILTSRTQYRSCHIRVPDDTQRLAAVLVGTKYYSFFRLIKEHQKTLQVAARLVYRGGEVVITKVAKGEVIWVYEPDVLVDDLVQEVALPLAQRRSESGLWVLLESAQDYQVCQIRVPDVAKPLEAIVFDRQYYGFMRRVRSQAEAIEFSERLGSRGNQSIITKSDRNYVVWVLEPDAAIA